MHCKSLWIKASAKCKCNKCLNGTTEVFEYMKRHHTEKSKLINSLLHFHSLVVFLIGLLQTIPIELLEA